MPRWQSEVADFAGQFPNLQVLPAPQVEEVMAATTLDAGIAV